MKTYKKEHIFQWFDDYQANPDNHYGCILTNNEDDEPFNPSDCECDLGSARDFIDFLIEKLEK